MKSIASFLLAAWALGAQAQDAGRGRELYQTHCLGCHYERIHKRDASRSLVRTLPQLRVEVVRRAELTGRRFSVEDVDDIAEYLNQSHYRLGMPSSGVRELIYGGELMSAEEREQYRQEVTAGGEAVRARHRERIRQRARSRGVDLAEPAGTLRR